MDANGLCCPLDSIDCLGVCNGNYGIGRNLVENDLFCCPAASIDCAGICNGEAYIDECGICSEGTSGMNTSSLVNRTSGKLEL